MQLRRFAVPVDTRVPGGTTNAYLLGESNALLVDPAGRTDALDAAVADRDVTHIAVTHTHPDHVDALAHYADVTDATVWARQWRTDRFRAATGITPDRTFREGSTFTVDDTPITVLDTPGHAADHVAFETPVGVICGDLAVAEGSVTVSAPEGDMLGYLVALRRLHARNPATLYPGHGSTIETPRETLARLIHHRRAREQRILEAVRAGATDPDAVLDAAYDKDLTGVRDLARATVVAHLEKLAAEHQITWDPATEKITTDT